MHRLMPRHRNHCGHTQTQKNYASLFYTWVFSIVVSVLVFSAPFSAYSPSESASFDGQSPQLSFSDFGLSLATRYTLSAHRHQQDTNLDNSDEPSLLAGYQTQLCFADVSFDIFTHSCEYIAFYWKGIPSRGPPFSL